MTVPKVIIHNSVSLDGAINCFEVDIGLHYEIAGSYKADVHLVGSNTILDGIRRYGTEIPPEEKSDFFKPEKDAGLPLWVIPDSGGKLRGILHYLRRTDFCRDVAILISRSTAKEYIGYLEARSYDYYVSGSEHVDFRKAFDFLSARYDAKTIMVDAGTTLNSILLENGLVDEIHLLIAPYLVGQKSSKLFSGLCLKSTNIELEQIGCREVKKNIVLLSYRVLR